MRILHILDHSIPLESDYSRRTQLILREQRALGWETFHLTGPRQGRATVQEEEVEGWMFHRTAAPGGLLEGLPVLGTLDAMGDVAYRIEQVFKHVRPSVLHAHSPALVALPALRVARRVGVPVVYEVRDLRDCGSFLDDAGETSRRNSFFGRLLEAWVMKRVDSVVARGSELARGIAARGVPPDRITILSDAVKSGVTVRGNANTGAEAGHQDLNERVITIAKGGYQEVYARLLQEGWRP